MNKNRICLCCGTAYRYCPTCGQDARKPKWMLNFDEEACKELFNVISGFNMGIKSKDQVEAVLDQYQITDFSKYSEGIQKVLNDLFPKKKVKEEVKELDVELKSEVEEPTATEEAEEEIPKRRYSAKRRGDIQE